MDYFEDKLIAERQRLLQQIREEVRHFVNVAHEFKVQNEVAKKLLDNSKRLGAEAIKQREIYERLSNL